MSLRDISPLVEKVPYYTEDGFLNQNYYLFP